MLDDLLAKIPPNNSLYRPGTVVTVGSWLGVNVDGNIIAARYADPLVLAVGDPVLVLIGTNGPYGQSEAFVLCRLTGTARPSTGIVTVVPASSPTISVRGVDGVTYTATFAYTSPAVNDNVILSWNAAVPTAVAKVTTTAAAAPPPAPVAPPPGQLMADTAYYAATDSSSYWATGGWDSWAGGGGNVYQGEYGSGNVYGAWFYNSIPNELAGRTITRIRFQLGQRRKVGNYNAPVTVHLYAHTNPTRPGGDVNRVAGPADFTIQPNSGAVTLDLPVSWAGTITSGGGVGMALDPYAGFEGRYSQPNSGALAIDWNRY